MNLLIIDNETKYLSELKKTLNDYSIFVVKYSNISSVNSKEYDAIVLSGGYIYPVIGNEKLYQDEFELVKNSTCPIFGICLGCQIINFVYGGKLKRLNNKIIGYRNINVIRDDRIFKKITRFTAYESHQWMINQVPYPLEALAQSKDGIEVIKHKSRLIYGVQFHPEKIIYQTEKSNVLLNFLHIVEKNKIIK